MAQSKIVFLDVDGTITDYENNVPQSAKDAIKAARANGHRVYMCTGRSKAENPPEIWEIGFDGMIGGNGCYVESEGEVVMHQLHYGGAVPPHCGLAAALRARVLPRIQQRPVRERTVFARRPARS